MSIKKEYCDLIKSKHKVYEFRTKLPKRLPIKKIYVYEMLPTSSLKYILIVDTPISKNDLYQKYGIVPPQSFVYIDTYQNLKIDITTNKLIKIF